jgi:nitroimidazol reductase NimA-like FMN-containing flavoprotein (pyridoxamine 5'-phosphate oxidase superfamily)
MGATSGMAMWRTFVEARPELAAQGEAMLFQHGVGLGFLATVRADGGPRVHPICPMVHGDSLYAFIVPGPKLDDLRRDPRFALHSETSPPPDHDDGFYVTGTATELVDDPLRRVLMDKILAERDLEELWAGFEHEALVELGVDRCLLTLTRARDGLPAGHATWHA